MINDNLNIKRLYRILVDNKEFINKVTLIFFFISLILVCIKTNYYKSTISLYAAGELDDSGLIKEYYSGLSHISREYIETKYFIRTLEMTTEEIDGARKLFPVKSDHLSEWIEFLYAADQVKYARSIPKAEMMLIHKNKVKSMIEQL